MANTNFFLMMKLVVLSEVKVPNSLDPSLESSFFLLFLYASLGIASLFLPPNYLLLSITHYNEYTHYFLSICNAHAQVPISTVAAV